MNQDQAFACTALGCVAAAALQAACGGAAPAQAASVMEPTSAQVAAASSHMLVPHHMQALGSPLLNLLQQDASLAPACSGGSKPTHIEAAAADEGQGTPTRAGGYSHCEWAYFPSANISPGNVSYSYALRDMPARLGLPFVGDFTANLQSLRYSSSASSSNDLSGDGRVDVSLGLATSGDEVVQTATFIASPQASSVTNNHSMHRATMLSGSHEDRLAFKLAAGSSRITEAQTEYRDLSYLINGRTYLMRGSESRSFDAAGQPTGATGEIQILAGAAVVARLKPALPDGYTVLEVSSSLGAF